MSKTYFKRNIKTALSILFFVLCLALTLAATVWATPLTTDAENLSPLSEFLADIGKVIPPAMVIAFVSCMLGYIKSTPPEDFELVKFLSTLLISIMVGIVSTATGWDYNEVIIWLANANITTWTYWFIKGLAIKLGWIAVPIEEPLAEKPG